MTEPATLHIWMPDMRSLCDRRARLDWEHRDDDAKFADEMEDSLTAPVCGACVVVASHIRSEAAALLGAARHRSIHPPSPGDAYRSLKGTRWWLSFDKDAPEKIESPEYYQQSIVDFIAERWLDKAAADHADENQRWRERIEARRNPVPEQGDEPDPEG